MSLSSITGKNVVGLTDPMVNNYRKHLKSMYSGKEYKTKSNSFERSVDYIDNTLQNTPSSNSDSSEYDQ